MHPNRSIERERVVLAVSEVHDIALDVSGAATLQEIRNRVSEMTNGLLGAARVTLSGELSPNIDIHLSDFSTIESSLDSLLVRMGSLHVAYEIESIVEEQTVRGEFVRSVNDTDLPDDQKRRILVTGLRALDGRNDLEVF